MLNFTIRTATAADTEAVTRIYIDSWNASFGPLMSQANRTVTCELTERWRRDLGLPPPHRWWVAERESTVLGFIGICPSRDPIDTNLGEIDTIAIDEPYWRQGVGSRLMTLALRQLAADGYDQAVLWTVEGYRRGIGFYGAMRWTRHGGVRDNGRQIRFRHDLLQIPQLC